MLINGPSTKIQFLAVQVIVNFLTLLKQKHGFYQSTLFERNRIIFYYNIYQDIPLQVRIVTMNNLSKLICVDVKDLNSIIKRRKKQKKLAKFQADIRRHTSGMQEPLFRENWFNQPSFFLYSSKKKEDGVTLDKHNSIELEGGKKKNKRKKKKKKISPSLTSKTPIG